MPRRLIEPTPDFLTAGIPSLDGKTPAEMVSAYRLGKGRGVWLNYGAHALTPFHEFSWRGVAEYDYWMLLVGRAALWAASREGDISIDSVLGDEGAVVERETSPFPGEVTVSINNGRTFTVELYELAEWLAMYPV